MITLLVCCRAKSNALSVHNHDRSDERFIPHCRPFQHHLPEYARHNFSTGSVIPLMMSSRTFESRSQAVGETERAAKASRLTVAQQLPVSTGGKNPKLALSGRPDD